MVEHPLVELSERELEILKLLATGASNKEIAQKLFISANTVKVHLRNIFSKTGVASRTEAAMYAVRLGLIQTVDSTLSQLSVDRELASDEIVPQMGADEAGITSNIENLPTWQRIRHLLISWRGLSVFVILFIILGLGFLLYQRTQPLSPKISSSSSPLIPTFSEMAPLPVARQGLAVTAYNNLVYAIGGESAQGVTGLTESFDPLKNHWRDETSKPTPVVGINAAVIGGLIYVPGGKLASGQPTNVLEVYDPNKKIWEIRASLPKPISDYALIAYEGRLFLFGGWDGQNYLASVYEYDPEKDTWLVLTSMPSVRAYAGAAIAGGRIYIIGGYDGIHALADNLRYDPDQDKAGQNPWQNAQPLPQPRYAMGVIGVVDVIQVIGGKGDSTTPLQTLQYSHQLNNWQPINSLFPDYWVDMGLVSQGTEYFAMGGEINGKLSAKNFAYKTVYIIAIPVIK